MQLEMNLYKTQEQHRVQQCAGQLLQRFVLMNTGTSQLKREKQNYIHELKNFLLGFDCEKCE